MTSCDKKLNTGAMVEVVYPKTYSIDDYDSLKELWEQHPVDDNFIEAINEFSYKTSVSILADDSKNINYSPLSLYYALSLALTKAKPQRMYSILQTVVILPVIS